MVILSEIKEFNLWKIFKKEIKVTRLKEECKVELNKIA
jgi:hypothetical protein